MLSGGAVMVILAIVVRGPPRSRRRLDSRLLTNIL